jgi:predicted Rossmann-fold nucleotide-binding protein
MQTDKMPRMPIFLIGKSYWRPLEKFMATRLEANSLISKGDRQIYKITDNIMDVVKAAEKIGHHKIDENVYDNMKLAKSPAKKDKTS